MVKRPRHPASVLSSRRDPAAKILRALLIMSEVSSKTWGVRELAKGLQVAPSGAHRILSILERQELVQFDEENSRYRLSLKFFRLAWKVAAGFPLAQTALPVMQDLVKAINETVVLALYDPVRTELMFIASVDSPHPIRHVVELNEWLPVHVGASGLAIMAFLPREGRNAIIAKARLTPVTDKSIVRAGRLEEELARIRRCGYAFTIGQRTRGTVGIAAPIWGPDRRVIGSLVLTILEQRFHLSRERPWSLQVIEGASRITQQIGGVVERDGLESDSLRSTGLHEKVGAS